MSKKLLFLAFLLNIGCYGFAQQVPFYNHNLINPFIYNPAMTGHSGTVNVFVARNQRYMGYGTGAANNYLTVDGDFFVPNMGFGLNLNMQSVGLQQQVNAQLFFAYKLKLAEDHKLSFGISGGYLDNRIDVSGINVSQLDDPFLTGMQPNIAAFDFNAGLVYEWKDLRFGFSVPQLIGNKVKYSKENSRGYYALARHFMGTLEYDFKFLESKDLVLTPHVLVRYIPRAPIQYDISAQLDYKKIGWLSVTYKSDYAIQFNLGVHILSRFHIGYSYEYVINTFKNNYSGFNHEFLVGYTFKQKEKVVENPLNDELIGENQKLKEDVTAKEKEIEEIEAAKEEEVQRRVEEELKKRLAEFKAEQDKIKQENTEKNNNTANTNTNNNENTDNTNNSSNNTSNNTSDNADDMNDEKVVIAKGYHFIELDDSDSPDGFYVISGVYSSENNSSKQLNKIKSSFSDAYVVINQKNTYRYVVVKYSVPKRDAYNAIKQFRNSFPDDKVWLLNYKKP